jgi:predicted kinase
MLGLAQRYAYHTCLLVFNIAPETCIQQDLKRSRSVGEQVIAYHTGLLQQTLLAIPGENWDEIYVIDQPSAKRQNGTEVRIPTFKVNTTLEIRADSR